MKQKSNLLLYLSILSIFACCNCFGAIDGALSKIAVAMQVNHTTAMYVCSIATLASSFASLFFGVIAGKKLSYRKTVLFCCTLMIVSAQSLS